MIAKGKGLPSFCSRIFEKLRNCDQDAFLLPEGGSRVVRGAHYEESMSVKLKKLHLSLFRVSYSL